MLFEIPEKLMRGPKPGVSPTEGCWIAGGAIRGWYIGDEKVSDIDIFAMDAERAKVCAGYNELGSPTWSSAAADTYKTAHGIVQVIKRYFPSVEATLDSFDFTICCFAWDGNRIMASPEAVDAVHRKHLAVHAIQPGFEADSLRRAFKYAKKGYWPCAGTIRDMAVALSKSQTDEETITRQLSPGGNLRWD